MTSARKRPSPGFTLIELIVVIAIIGLLTALLLPALGRAKGWAQSSKCKSNLRQIDQMLQVFVDENHEYPNLLRQAAKPFLRWPAEGVATCPSDKWGKGSSGRWTDYDEDNRIKASGTGKYGSYGYNAQGGGGDSWNPKGPNEFSQSRTDLGLMGRNESALKNPSDMIAITGSYAEVNHSIMRSLQARINGTSPGMLYAQASKDAYARHFGKLNTAFCDGHIESLKVDVLYHDKSDQMLKRWNYDNEPHREQGWKMS